jgi:hypothetical protein
MTRSLPPYRYRLFDRYLASDIPLQLLQPTEIPDRTDAAKILKLRLDKTVTPIVGEFLFEQIAGSFNVVSHDNGVTVTFWNSAWAARVSWGSPGAVLHPVTDETGQLDGAELAAIGDRVVTVLLSRLPQQWGMVAIHGALLGKGDDSIALIGRSGAGKSTLSQVLARDFGWRILDDDTFGFYPGNKTPQVWAMGAHPRVRQDAADALNLMGTKLPGYQGGKMFIPTTPVEGLQNSVNHSRLSAIFFLDPDSPEANNRIDQKPQFFPSTPQRAVGPIHDQVMALNPFREGFPAARFQASAVLANTPAGFLRYRHGGDAPQVVAQELDVQAKKLKTE